MGVFGAIKSAVKAPVKAVQKLPGMGAAMGAVNKAPGMGGMMGAVNKGMGIGPSQQMAPKPPAPMNGMLQGGAQLGGMMARPSVQPQEAMNDAPSGGGMYKSDVGGGGAMQDMSQMYGGGGGGGQMAEAAQMYSGGNSMPQVAQDDMIKQAGEGALGAQQAMGIGPSPQMAPSPQMQRRPMGRQMGRRY